MAKFNANMRSLLYETGLREAYTRRYGMTPLDPAEYAP